MINRKPMGSAAYVDHYRIADKDFLDGEWMERFLALRRAGKLGIVLCDHNRYWITHDRINPWGPEKKPITAAELRAMIVVAEGRAA